MAAASKACTGTSASRLRKHRKTLSVSQMSVVRSREGPKSFAAGLNSVAAGLGALKLATAFPLSRGRGTSAGGDARSRWADQNRADASAENEGITLLFDEEWFESFEDLMSSDEAVCMWIWRLQKVYD